MSAQAIQDSYPPAFAHCYGCGANNQHGHHLKSYLVGNETVARFTPDLKYSGGVPDHVYGGMIASLLDCHGTASAAAYAYQKEGRQIGDGREPVRFVTASLKVDFKRPTPLGVELVVRGMLRSLDGRKAWIDLVLTAGELTCATGEMLAIRLPEPVDA
ncbi:PaaI family thioesterase [Variovorax paradoxus]|jgi:acyl-coenzyme A thioesterase PaaI-like protein|uniref:PaaI family thioesterase n=1 Tax=Variovorax paradoxus TaxID=34073 RepID=UPI0029C966ED|nr:PaaI family thioesterase [Variovorax paradoxus]WPH23083.1 PaaI family thioesterase [Variovorax paradoxus]